ncbi:hypothetical protein SSX86_009094 [Deinandra increscens subsp. villosa]|uniref:Cytochrome P450 n=1 Tax=Deinandra increscens subsp. villosa TaxID=3103831 RepID=A0AAP0H4K6_9ASTR
MDLQSSLCFIFFTFTAIFSLFSLSLFIIRFNPCCSCEICTAFITRAWTSEFVNLSDWYTHLLRNSATGTIHVHVLNNIITANPDNVEYMIKTNFDNFPKGKAFSDILGDLLGRGIFNVDGNHWRFQRKLASLELGSLAIRSHALKIVSDEIESRLIPLFLTVAEKGENDENDAVLDLQDVFRRFSFDSICKFSFGSDPGSLTPSLPVSELESAFDLSSKRCAERGMTPSPLVWKFKRLFNIGSEKELKSSVNVVKKMAGKIIKERREMDPKSSKCSDPGQTNDLLSRFMGSISDDDYLRDIVISFLLAGRDTVASALTSFFLTTFPKPEGFGKDPGRVGPGHRPGPRNSPRVRAFTPLALPASGIAREHAALPAGAVRFQVHKTRRCFSRWHVCKTRESGDVPPVRDGTDGADMGAGLVGVQTREVDPRRGV